jgi:transposase
MYTRQIGGRRVVTTRKGRAVLSLHLVGPHPIIRHFLGRMNFWQIVSSCLGSPRAMSPDHAQTLSALIQNILLSPSPLYRIGEWSRPISPDALGFAPDEKRSLNDDRVARTLDALVTSSARSLFFRLALRVIKEFELDTARVHQDTTTITFHGEYRASHTPPRITHGYNKDHRPDLKQLVFGINVTADGAVPISHEVYNGNRTDDTIHQSNVDHLRTLLGRDDFIYVADGKLCTGKNLEHIVDYGGLFVTVLPRTRTEDKQFRQSLRRGESASWRKFVEIPDKRRRHDPPAIYSTTTQGLQRTKEDFRLVWCRSSQKAKLDAIARGSAIEKAEAEFVELNARLNKRHLRSRKTIANHVKDILYRHKCKLFICATIRTRTTYDIKRIRRGRPKKGDPVRKVPKRAFYLDVQRDKDALRAEARTDGVFALVTNIPRMSKKDVLLTYKYQPFVEKRHALFKSELEVAPVYIKKPLRAVGLIHATFLAMTVDALIERALRQGMARHGLESLPLLPEGRKTKTPTTARLLEAFSDVSWYEVDHGGETVVFPITLTPLQQELLQMLGMSPKNYA